MILMLPSLYIGSIDDVVDVEYLQKNGITHILTVDNIQQHHLTSFKTKYVYLLDDSNADLLSCLSECLNFLEEALGLPGSSALVHCHAGVSRSAAIITAYLMSTTRCTYEEAYKRLQSVKPDIKISDEFVNQLKLFETMGSRVNMDSASYKLYRLQRVTEKYPELQKLPTEVFASDPHSSAETKNVLYRCRKCRRSLFRAESILNHALGVGSMAFPNKRSTSMNVCRSTQCTSYFIEPVQWMQESLLGVMDGQLLCPKCHSKLGSFNWYGEQCSCGCWVTPAFQIHKNRVDEIKPVPFYGKS